MSSNMEFHPLANEFPLMEGDQFEALVESIGRDGLQEPILLFDGMILDGRNRYRACIKAGVDPKYTIFEEDDPSNMQARLRYVETRNLNRRHLSDGQRALIAVRMAELRGMTTEQAAAALQVKPRTAQKAAVVHRHGSKNVIDLVQRGAVSINRAHAVTTGLLPEGELQSDARRTKRGRPIGDAHVNALRNVIADLEPLYDYGDKIGNHWPGDPDLNRRLAVAADFMQKMLKRTREVDYADVGT